MLPTPTTPDGSDPEKYLRRQLNIPEDVRVDLLAVQNPPDRGKPSQPLTNLVKLAIFGSPQKKLTTKEIYQELIDHFDWFKDQEDEVNSDGGYAWKVRCVFRAPFNFGGIDRFGLTAHVFGEFNKSYPLFEQSIQNRPAPRY